MKGQQLIVLEWTWLVLQLGRALLRLGLGQPYFGFELLELGQGLPWFGFELELGQGLGLP